MSFFSKLTPSHRKGEKNFERARAAEGRRDFDAAMEYFHDSAKAYDVHFAESEESGKALRPSHLVMAGISYTRIGRNADALEVLNACLALKEIPDAFLHAGYAAAKLSEADKAVDYWEHYPAWADQRIIATALKEQTALIRTQGEAALQSACEVVAEAVFRQDKENAKSKPFSRGKQKVPAKRGY